MFHHIILATGIAFLDLLQGHGTLLESTLDDEMLDYSLRIDLILA
jgi:hypothetical protein